MFFRCIPVGVLQANCYITACPKTKHAFVIDPGAEPDLILSVISQNDLEVKYILNTHGHPDHIGANTAIKQWSGAPLLIHKADANLLIHPLPLPFENEPPVESPPADQFLNDGDKLQVGNVSLQVLYTPGHSPGSVSFLFDDRVITGDALFAGTVGRTDLPGGDMPTLIKAIHEKLLVLDDETEVYPGHGPSTTIGQEKQYNPFFADLQ